MLEGRTTVTRKGQVTVPVEIRKALGLREGDKVTFTMEDGAVRLDKAGSVARRTAGAIRARGRPPSVKQLREAAEQAIADEAGRRMRG